MASFKYTATNDLGKTVKGEISAENEVDLEERLKQLGLELLYCRERRERKGGGGSVKVKDQEIIVMCMHMEQMGKAGVPLMEILADVRDSTDSKNLKNIMAGVYEYVKAGEILSKALSRYPRVFNDVFVGLVIAGEKTGNLSDAFVNIANHLKWTSELRRKVKKATRYPVVLLLVMSGVIAALMIVLVPKLTQFMSSQGFDLPIHTRALIATSAAFENYWWIIFGIPLTIFIVVKTMYRFSFNFAYKVDSMVLNMPVFGNVARKLNMARFCHFFSVMFASGIDVIESLEGARNVVANRKLQESVEQIIQSVTDGSSLTNAMRYTNQFPNLVIRMFKIGEESGNMTESLHNVNFFFDREVNDTVDAAIGMIQPTLTVVMGVLIFWVIAAMFGPLYQSFSKMNV